MKRNVGIFLIFFFFLFTPLSGGAQATSTDASALIQNLENRIAALQAQMIALQNDVAQLKSALGFSSTSAPTPQRGETSDEVRRVQEFLTRFPDVYPRGLVTGYFGDLTSQALLRFQTKYGVPQTGLIDPLTRAKILELQTPPPLQLVTSTPAVLPTSTLVGIPTPTSTPIATSTPSGISPRFSFAFPLRGDIFTASVTSTIQWGSSEQQNTVPKVHLSLYSNGIFKEFIAADVPNTGSYQWAPAERLAGALYTIKIFSILYPTHTTESVPFSIVSSAYAPTSPATTPSVSSGSTGSTGSTSQTTQPTVQTTTTTLSSALSLTGVNGLFDKIWGPGSNGIIIGGGLNFSTQVGVGWSQQYGGKYVTSYSIQGTGSHYLTQTNPQNVAVSGPAGSMIEVWDMENMGVVATNFSSPGAQVVFSAQPNRRYGGFGWYADNSQQSIAIYASYTASSTTTNATSTTTSASPAFTITAPNGGEQLSNGSIYTIRWTPHIPSISTASIYLYKSGGLVMSLTDNAPNTGTWTWTPAVTASGDDYTIRIFNNNYQSLYNYDDSNSPFSIAIPTPAPSTPPIGYWKFDGNGTNEISGGASAVAQGSAVFQSSGGKLGGYAYILGASDSVKIPYSSIFDLPNSFTIEFWFRQRSDRSFAQNLVSKGTGPNNYNFYIFRQLWNQYNYGPIITGFTSSQTGYWTQTSNPNQLAHNAWHHVVFTKNTTGSAYYLDGALIHASSQTDQAKTPATDIIIGNSAVDTDMDNLRVYNYALTLGEILYNYNGGTGIAQAEISPTAQSQFADITAAFARIVNGLQTLLRR